MAYHLYNSNGARQDDITTLLASSLTDISINFFITLVSVKRNLWSAVSTPSSPTHTLSTLCWVVDNTNSLLLIQISWKSGVVLKKCVV